MEIDHEISSSVILPLIQEGQLSVTGESMCTNTRWQLRGLLNMLNLTLMGRLGHKTSTQKKKKIYCQIVSCRKSISVTSQEMDCSSFRCFKTHTHIQLVIKRLQVWSPRGLATFFHGSWNISMVILSLPLIQEGQFQFVVKECAQVQVK